MRQAEIKRKTAETDITLLLDLDGSGKSSINSGSGFMDHMLTLFASHGRFDLMVSCEGDTYVDYHHSVEDIGIALGAAFNTFLIKSITLPSESLTASGIVLTNMPKVF